MRPVRLTGPVQREYAKRSIDQAPEGYVVTIKEPTRSTDQNAKMWAMLQDVARTQPQGRKHTPDDWKCLFMNAMGFETRFVMGLDDRPFPVGFKSSQLTVREMADLITFIQAWGDEQGVIWMETRQYEGAA
jgi:hypothetical protein